MIEVNAVLASVVVELLVALCLLCLGLWYFKARKQKRIKLALQAMMGQVKTKLEVRKNELLRYYKKFSDDPDENINKSINNHLAHERNLYQQFINIVLSYDVKLIHQFAESVNQAIKPFHDYADGLENREASQDIVVEELDPADVQTQVDLSHGTNSEQLALVAKVEQLEKTVTRLNNEKSELGLEIEAMNNALTQMLEEYSRAFNEFEKASGELEVKQPAAAIKQESEPQEINDDMDENERLAAEWANAISEN